MAAIDYIDAQEILDSRGNPTVEVEVILGSGARGLAAVRQRLWQGGEPGHRVFFLQARQSERLVTIQDSEFLRLRAEFRGDRARVISSPSRLLHAWRRFADRES